MATSNTSVNTFTGNPAEVANSEISGRSADSHVHSLQCWTYSEGGNTTYFYLSHAEGALNGLPGYATAHQKSREKSTFFQKHLLMPSKSGATVTEKAVNRARKRARITRGGRTSGGISHAVKFGGHAGTNTVLDLNVCNPAQALEAMRNAIVGHAWGGGNHATIRITFAAGSVLTSSGGGAPVAGQTMRLGVAKLNDQYYDITHCEGT